MRLGAGRHDVVRDAAGDHADVDRRFTELIIVRPLEALHLVQERHEILDGGMAEVRIGGMRGLSARPQREAHRSLRAGGERALGWLAIDKNLARRTDAICRLGAVVRHLLTDDEKQRNGSMAFAQLLGGQDHGGCDAFRVTRAASPQPVAIQTRRNEWRDGVEMRR